MKVQFTQVSLVALYLYVYGYMYSYEVLSINVRKINHKQSSNKKLVIYFLQFLLRALLMYV